MLTIETLKDFGANTEEALGRCFNNESFYLRMVGMGLADGNFDKLQAAMAAGDAKAAFEAAHALKGSLGNLSLTPIYKPVCALSDMLKSGGATADGEALLAEALAQLERARAL